MDGVGCRLRRPSASSAVRERRIVREDMVVVSVLEVEYVMSMR